METISDFVELGQRIRHVRLVVGVSQDELAAVIGVDRTAVSRIESGGRKVSAVDLVRIAARLGVTLADLVTRPDPVALAARSPLPEDPIGSEQNRGRAELELDAAWRDLQQLRSAGLLGPVDFPYGRPFGSKDDARSLARDVRRHLSLGEDPIGSVSDLAADLGLWCRTTSLKIDGLSMTPEPGLGVCLVYQDLEPGRRRMTVAHEIGHHVSGDTYEPPEHYTSPSEAESRIEAFAAELLLPAAVTSSKSRPSREELITVAATYRVSWSVVVQTARATGCDLSGIDTEDRPRRDEFLRVIGAEPQPDMLPPGLPRAWVRACARAQDKEIITPRRAREMSMGLTADEGAEP